MSRESGIATHDPSAHEDAGTSPSRRPRREEEMNQAAFLPNSRSISA